MIDGVGARISMVGKDAGREAEMPSNSLENCGRNPRSSIAGASDTTATREPCCPESLRLMEAVVERENMMVAYKAVMRNKGSPGVDGMTVEALMPYLRLHWQHIKGELLEDGYCPQPVLCIEIPKPGGKGMRMLGIPTVVDRLIQQAVHQVLGPVFDGGFSASSFGFRPGRSAHQAVLQARQFVAEGRRWVVDLDLEKFFDRVNHDILMSRVARKVEDKRVLRLIRRYLQAGMMIGGLEMVRTEGTPQGGPLSPLLSNILLDDLDKELERRHHSFCRYADDSNIYVRSREAGERVMASVTQFLEENLKLRVNREKSAVARPWDRKFLGYSVTSHKIPRLKVAPENLARFRQKIRKEAHKGRGRNLQVWIKETLTPIIRGWGNYFRLAEVKKVFEELDSWLRRRLRVIIWRQLKRHLARAKALMKQGLDKARAWKSATNGRGPWWNSGARHMNEAYPNRFFVDLGLMSLLQLIRNFQCQS